MENNGNLTGGVISEVDLLETWNIEKRTLDKLRLEKGLPYVRLDKLNRVYLRENVVAWAKKNLYVA